ncbi:hypothetical protein ACV1CY_20570, partial [Aeromonas caviae]
MYHAFDLFSIISLVLIIAVIVIALFQLNRPATIVLSSPSWLIVLMSPATVLPLVPILFLVHRGFPGKAALIFRKKYSESLNP